MTYWSRSDITQLETTALVVVSAVFYANNVIRLPEIKSNHGTIVVASTPSASKITYLILQEYVREQKNYVFQ